ncbi:MULTISPECIES: methanogenesis marker 7 protein [Methanothrix]|jgi:putative methanogenesis marker protein 7|uniref:Methanogenesis marker 7 protein n=2 Tax=Methanothrix soehngenii TaxID=2223 RepID=A0A7K4AF39_METSH|nr:MULTISPECIES: methanogenesis marker 7 protein [Methanothrix]NYT10270.1 methanogenesis marker 7 protein [Methanosarcinales archaeon]AEB67259.1 putative methanogenesis marker protein 7 [Methanothrix soehngenii GP6]MBP7068259.1 methanogenesis marker 7 protein [Methanothrix sp.]MDD3551206.1 methanogenesis marker 7 protein [Methanothrix soehngenii]MDY0411556.1 methanogenesis marker 7 protein [Methanothrix soehngenii]
MLEPVMFTGGLYKHDLVLELVEDLGGYILQKNVTQTEIILLLLVPSEDMNALEILSRDLRGELVRAPLAGTEVAVVTPTLAIHHLPHVACDIAEYLRRHGSKTNMIGMARGVGREIAQINEYETALINEHDAAVFIFGNFEDCIKKKEDLYRNIGVPVIITGGPKIDPEELPYAFGYVPSIGRMAHRTRKATEIGSLDNIVEMVGRALDKTREAIAKDPLTTSPPRVMDAVREQVPEVEFSYSPLPIALNLTGVRVKLPYAGYRDKVAAVTFDEGVKLGEVATIRPSRMKDYILVRILPSSETGFVF